MYYITIYTISDTENQFREYYDTENQLEYYDTENQFRPVPGTRESLNALTRSPHLNRPDTIRNCPRQSYLPLRLPPPKKGDSLIRHHQCLVRHSLSPAPQGALATSVRGF